MEAALNILPHVLVDDNADTETASTAPTYKVHSLAELFPEMEGEAFEALVADIKNHGQREPIVINDANEILDGRNRYNACLEAKVSPKFEKTTLDGDKWLDMVLSRNMHRRHLKESQRAAVAANIATLKPGGRKAANLPDTPTQEQAAKMLNVSERSVRTAVAIKAASPKLYRSVCGGVMSLNAANKEVATEKLKKLPKKSAVRSAMPKEAPPKSPEIETADKIPHVYSRLYEELDELSKHLVSHPLSPGHRDQLAAALNAALRELELK